MSHSLIFSVFINMLNWWTIVTRSRCVWSNCRNFWELQRCHVTFTFAIKHIAQYHLSTHDTHEFRGYTPGTSYKNLRWQWLFNFKIFYLNDHEWYLKHTMCWHPQRHGSPAKWTQSTLKKHPRLDLNDPLEYGHNWKWSVLHMFSNPTCYIYNICSYTT